ncbi:GNAT family N-acetyltransferase [Bacillus sp. C1]
MLETKRCVLETVHESDYENIKALYLNIEVRKYLGGPRKVETIKAVLDDMLHPKENCWYWIVREKETKEFMGVVSLNPHHASQDIEVSYQFFSKFWGVGYAAEAVQELINYGFRELYLSRVIAVTQMANTPSRKLLDRLHMKLIQTHYEFGAEQAIYVIEAKSIF